MLGLPSSLGDTNWFWTNRVSRQPLPPCVGTVCGAPRTLCTVPEELQGFPNHQRTESIHDCSVDMRTRPRETLPAAHGGRPRAENRHNRRRKHLGKANSQSDLAIPAVSWAPYLREPHTCASCMPDLWRGMRVADYTPVGWAWSAQTGPSNRPLAGRDHST